MKAPEFLETLKAEIAVALNQLDYDDIDYLIEKNPDCDTQILATITTQDFKQIILINFACGNLLKAK